MNYARARRQRLQKQLAQVQAALDNLYSTHLELTQSLADSYAFDSGEGSQRTTRKKINDVLDQIERLESTEARLINELYNMGLISVAVRRIPGADYSNI